MVAAITHAKDSVQSTLKTELQSLNGPLKFSYIEAFLTSFVVGLGENYFAAFSLQQGLTALQSGLLISLPLIFAAVFQFLLQPYFKYLSVSAYVSRATLLQSFALIAMAYVAIAQVGSPFFVLLVLFSVYWYGHFSLQPAWNRWISEIVTLESGQTYFSLRTRLNQVGIVLGLVLGGASLHLNILNISIEKLFLSVFILSFFCKAGAYFFFTKHQHVTVSLTLSRENMKKILFSQKKFFSRYALFNLAIYLSAPFVAGYLLSTRGLNYIEFMYIMSGLFTGKIVTSLIFNFSKKQFNPHMMMFVGGIIAGPLPILWPYCSTVFAMTLMHFASGMAWASWEVGLSLCFFKKISSEDKMELISVYNYIGVTTQVIGTCVGAFLVKTVFHGNYDTLFIVAGVLRLLCVLPLYKSELSSLVTPTTHESKSDPKKTHLTA